MGRVEHYAAPSYPACKDHPAAAPRPRVSLRLKQALDHRLTILQAGAGYGKSTALAELAEEIQPLVWYQVNEEDNDPLVFLLHLCHVIHQGMSAVQFAPPSVVL
ncbi:MAG: hypothetical protein QMD04_00180 [Anaerolineales bacterium]|nr:hypothetical protein [Anaerolineales bacterium]